MISKKISTRVVFRPSTKGGKYQGNLFFRLIHNRKIKTLTIPDCHLFSEEWDDDAQTIVCPENNLTREKYLISVADKIIEEKEKLLCQMKRFDDSFDLDDFIDNYRQRQEVNSNFLSVYCENHARHLEKNNRDRTARAYKGTVRRLMAFNQGKDILLSEINADLMKSFETHLKAEGVCFNTISFYMRNLRSIYNRAIKEKRIESQPENPFSDVKKIVQTTVKRALLAEDMQKVLDFDFLQCKDANQEERFRAAQRLFLFSFYTRGMCFVDIAYLRKQNIQNNNTIRYYRRKTGKMIEVKIAAETQHIIESFATDVCDSPYVFPIIKADNSRKARLQYESALRMQNIRLQKMAEMAGVQKKITMHVARHSWASIGKQNNLPLSVISECLGHSSEKVTEIYLASLDKTVLDDANTVVINAIKS